MCASSRIDFLNDIYEKISDQKITLKRVKELYQKADINLTNILTGAKSSEEELELKIVSWFVERLKTIPSLGTESECIKRKLTQFSDEQFDFVELFFGEFFFLLKHISSNWNSFSEEDKKSLEKGFLSLFIQTENIPNESKINEKLKEFNELFSAIKAERIRREQLKQNNNSDFSNNNLNSSVKNLNQQLKNLQDQISKLANNQPQNQDNSSELNQIKQQLSQLAKQIKGLEEKNPTNNNSQLKSQLNNLKTTIQQLSNQLDKKQSSSSKDSNQSQTQNDKFNWLYVVIPGGVIILVMAVIIAYLLGKKSKKE